MPSLLNSCWLVLVVCGAAQYFRCVAARQLPVGRRTPALALGCVLALLFPVISANDDWLQLQMMSDGDALCSIIKSSASTKNCKAHLAAALPSAPAKQVSICIVGHTVLFEQPVLQTLKTHATGDRSPPQTCS